jgi:hypothetical protein
MDSHYTDSNGAPDLAADLVADLAAEDTLIAETHWETKWIAAESTFDPAYERTTAALRRWVDGMEQALVANPGKRRRSARVSR